MRTSLPMLRALALVAMLPSCAATVHGVYDPQRCYWTWVADPFGGYEQLHCWNTGFGRYDPYLQGHAYVRRYPVGYAGPRVTVAAPPAALALPPAVVAVTPALPPPAVAVPAP